MKTQALFSTLFLLVSILERIAAANRIVTSGKFQEIMHIEWLPNQSQMHIDDYHNARILEKWTFYIYLLHWSSWKQWKKLSR